MQLIQFFQLFQFFQFFWRDPRIWGGSPRSPDSPESPDSRDTVFDNFLKGGWVGVGWGGGPHQPGQKKLQHRTHPFDKNGFPFRQCGHGPVTPPRSGRTPRAPRTPEPNGLGCGRTPVTWLGWAGWREEDSPDVSFAFSPESEQRPSGMCEAIE